MRASIVIFCPPTPSGGKNRQKQPLTLAANTPDMEIGPPQQSNM